MADVADDLDSPVLRMFDLVALWRYPREDDGLGHEYVSARRVRGLTLVHHEDAHVETRPRADSVVHLVALVVCLYIYVQLRHADVVVPAVEAVGQLQTVHDTRQDGVDHGGGYLRREIVARDQSEEVDRVDHVVVVLLRMCEVLDLFLKLRDISLDISTMRIKNLPFSEVFY